MNELHIKIGEMFEKMRNLKDLIEYKSKDIRQIIEEVVAKELPYFNSFSSIAKLAEYGFQT